MWKLITWHGSPKTGLPWQRDRQRQNKGTVLTIMYIHIDKQLNKDISTLNFKKIPVWSWKCLPVYHSPWPTTKNAPLFGGLLGTVLASDTKINSWTFIRHILKIWLASFRFLVNVFAVQMNGEPIDWIQLTPCFNFGPLGVTPWFIRYLTQTPSYLYRYLENLT